MVAGTIRCKWHAGEPHHPSGFSPGHTPHPRQANGPCGSTATGSLDCRSSSEEAPFPSRWDCDWSQSGRLQTDGQPILCPLSTRHKRGGRPLERDSAFRPPPPDPTSKTFHRLHEELGVTRLEPMFCDRTPKNERASPKRSGCQTLNCAPNKSRSGHLMRDPTRRRTPGTSSDLP